MYRYSYDHKYYEYLYILYTSYIYHVYNVYYREYIEAWWRHKMWEKMSKIYTASWLGAPHRPFEGMEQTNTDVIYKQLHLKGFKYSRVCPSKNRYPWFTGCRYPLAKVDFHYSLVQHLEQLFGTSKRKRSYSGGHHILHIDIGRI
jgi:hypothetical protein